MRTRNDSAIRKELTGIDFVKVQNKGKIPFWVSLETHNNSTSAVLVSFRYAHSRVHHFDFVN